MTLLFLIYCIAFFVQRSEQEFWTAAFQPIFSLSHSLAPRLERGILASERKRLHRILWYPRSFTSLLSSSPDKSDSFRNLQNKWLEKLKDPFDRWRFLQKLLDDNINDADDILFVLQACIQQRFQQLRTTPSRLVSMKQSQNSTASMESIVSVPADTCTPLQFVDTDGFTEDRLETMNIILQENSCATIQRLLQPVGSSSAPIFLCTPQDDRFLCQLERLLPDPALDEDASKGLWDTVIELHGRESVKINEQINTMNWRTRCLIARVLIFCDFLSDGLHPSNAFK
jgi:hypothetical protein